MQASGRGRIAKPSRDTALCDSMTRVKLRPSAQTSVRHRIIIIAAALSLPVLPLWAFAGSGVCLMQVMVQGAWGIIPVHLNELSPDEARGTFPGFTYQLGNLIASVNAPVQAALAAHWGGNYALALALVAGIVAVVIVVLTALGTEAKSVAFGATLATPPAIGTREH
jgi:MFS transporter, SHS family, lactate transporter